MAASDPDTAERAIKAFGALLAVARAAATQAEHPPPDVDLPVWLALRELDAAHPDWRDWTS